MDKVKKHVHKMEKVVTKESPLFDAEIIKGKPNYKSLGKKDVFYYKACECGFESPMKVERL